MSCMSQPHRQLHTRLAALVQRWKIDEASFLGCLWNAVQLHPEFASRSAPFYSFYSKMSVCLSFCGLDRTVDKAHTHTGS
mmetsp:Transcript_68538/g.121252  ORF Transcript_68538/g.121252 Transcript_68538/m.121252 type:complete len:80 (-) Transcript_68538:28-267(-)